MLLTRARRDSREIVRVPCEVGPLIERIESRHVGRPDLKVEAVRVFSDPLRANRLRDFDEAMLESPSDEDLSRGLAVLRGDFLDDGMLEATPAGERAVRFELDPTAQLEAYSPLTRG